MNLSLGCACIAIAAVLSACGAAPPSAPAAISASSGEAVETIGDTTVRASALQTSALNEAVARRYGIVRDDKTVLLLVTVRKGSGAAETSISARIAASASGLTGDKRRIEMRELRTGDLLDYIGTAETSLPETLRFEVDVTPEGRRGQPSRLQFTREFYPR